MRAVNLIPVEQRGGAAVGLGRSQGGAYAVVVVIAVLAGMAALYGKARHDVASRTAEVAQLQAQTAQAQADAGSLAAYGNLQAMRERRTQAVEEVVDSRFDWAHALHEFGRVLPSGVSISSLAGTIAPASGSGSAGAASAAASASSGGAGRSATPPGSVPSFTLTGCATSQPLVARTLERLRLMDGVKEVSLESSVTAQSGSAGGAGSCAGGNPSFSMTVSFEPLPAASAFAARPVSDTSTTATTAR